MGKFIDSSCTAREYQLLSLTWFPASSFLLPPGLLTPVDWEKKMITFWKRWEDISRYFHQFDYPCYLLWSMQVSLLQVYFWTVLQAYIIACVCRVILHHHWSQLTEGTSRSFTALVRAYALGDLALLHCISLPIKRHMAVGALSMSQQHS